MENSTHLKKNLMKQREAMIEIRVAWRYRTSRKLKRFNLKCDLEGLLPKKSLNINQET